MCPLAPRNCTETRVKAQVELLIASQLWTNVNQFAQTPVVNQCVDIDWQPTNVGHSCWIQTQSSEAMRHNTECRGTALPALTTVTLRSMGTGELLTPYRIKILESISKMPQLIRSTRGTYMPNLNKHLGEKSGKMIKCGILWLIYVSDLDVVVRSGDGFWPLTVQKPCNGAFNSPTKKLSKLSKFQLRNI